MDPADIRVIALYVGGGFGSKGPTTPRTALVALAARRLNRPVRCVVGRSQAFTVEPYRAPTRHRIRMGATADGKIAAFSHDARELTSRIDNYAVGGTATTTRMYGYGAVASNVDLVKADRQTPAYMRSPPELPYMFPLECAIDELAYKLGMDPIELRRVNDTDKEPIHGKKFTSRDLMGCFDAAAKAFNWSTRDPRPASMREGDWLIGMGCATAVYPTHVGAATARVRLRSDGQVLVQSASQEIGTGIRTVAGQMAAERLGIGFDAVHVEMGDSNLPPAPVSGGSNSTASVCSAVLKACEQIRARLFQAAIGSSSGPLAGKQPGDLDMRNGEVVSQDGASQKLADVFKTMGAGAVEEYAEFIPEGAPPTAVQELYGGKSTLVGGPSGKEAKFAFGAEFAEVRINARTREIRVPRLVGAFAAGRIMNTRTARSQLMGGMIWGMSAALLEATELDERFARTVNRDLQDYFVPVNADVQEVRGHHASAGGSCGEPGRGKGDRRAGRRRNERRRRQRRIPRHRQAAAGIADPVGELVVTAAGARSLPGAPGAHRWRPLPRGAASTTCSWSRLRSRSRCRPRNAINGFGQLVRAVGARCSVEVEFLDSHHDPRRIELDLAGHENPGGNLVAWRSRVANYAPLVRPDDQVMLH